MLEWFYRFRVSWVCILKGFIYRFCKGVCCKFYKVRAFSGIHASEEVELGLGFEPFVG